MFVLEGLALETQLLDDHVELLKCMDTLEMPFHACDPLAEVEDARLLGHVFTWTIFAGQLAGSARINAQACSCTTGDATRRYLLLDLRHVALGAGNLSLGLGQNLVDITERLLQPRLVVVERERVARRDLGELTYCASTRAWSRDQE